MGFYSGYLCQQYITDLEETRNEVSYMFFIGVDYSNTSPVYLMRQLIYAIGIGAQAFKKNTQSSVAVVGLLGRQFIFEYHPIYVQSGLGQD